MSHDLDFSKGFAAIAFRGETPWHSYGQRIEAGDSIEVIRTKAGLQYRVKSAPVMYHDHNGVLRAADGNVVLHRDDTGAHVGIVSDGYQVVQPEQIARFFEKACRDLGYSIETMGALRNGAVYWCLARTGQVMGEARGDPIHSFVLISTSADGSASTIVKQTAVRVVCANTIAIAHADKSGKEIRVRHSTTFNPDAVQAQMGMMDLESSWEKFRSDMNKLAACKVDHTEAEQFFSTLLRPPKPTPAGAELKADTFAALLGTDARINSDSPVAVAAEPVRAIRGLSDLMNSYQHAPGAVTGNAYGLLQGVTHYVDHVRGTDAKRLQSSWFGQGASLKERAMESALTLADLRNAR